MKQLTKQLLERAMAAELTEHVGYEKHDPVGHNSGNSRNDKSANTLKGTFGTLPIEVPRDRNGTFEPQIIEKHQTRFTGFDGKIIWGEANAMLYLRDRFANDPIHCHLFRGAADSPQVCQKAIRRPNSVCRRLMPEAVILPKVVGLVRLRLLGYSLVLLIVSPRRAKTGCLVSLPVAHWRN